MGIFFSAGWSPCVGPVLSAILTLAIQGGSIAEGTKFLAAYSAGLAIPFLLAALELVGSQGSCKNMSKLTHYVEIIMGIILIIVGIMLFFGILAQLNRFRVFFDLGL